MISFIFRRLLQLVPVLFVIVTVTFFMVRAAPGGPFSGERVVRASIMERMNEHYGLNDPLPVQYLNYLKNLAQGDLGPSFQYEGRRVNELIGESFPISLQLGLYALSIALVLGMFAGVIAAIWKNKLPDYASMTVAMIGICLPTFVMGPILALVFGLWLGWFNVSGWFTPGDRVLPALTLGLFYAGYVARLTRGGLLDVLSQDFIRTARAKGIPERLVILRHSLRGGLLPAVSFLGPALAGLVSGSFVVETIFNVPGLGQYFVKAAFNRDYTMVMGTVLFYAALIIVMNLIVDIIQVLMNPRLKYE